MKKNTLIICLLILPFIAILSLGCENSKQISNQEFENDLQNLFNIVMYDNSQGTKSLAYNYGMGIDSTSIYYDLVHGFNNQYLLFLTRKPFIELNLKSFIVEQDTLEGTKQKIFEEGRKQPWFNLYKTSVAYYLKGKGVSVQNYEPQPPVSATQEELMEVVSKFFYVYDYDEDKGLQAKLCGGINPYFKEDLVINPVMEAFAFQALVNLLGEDTSLVTSFYQGFISEMNEKVKTMNDEKEGIVQFAKNNAYQHYKNDAGLREKIIAQYQELKNRLPFEISDLPSQGMNQ